MFVVSVHAYVCILVICRCVRKYVCVLCVHVHICNCVYVPLFVRARAYIHAHTCVFVCERMHTRTGLCEGVHVRKCMHACMLCIYYMFVHIVQVCVCVWHAYCV